MLYLWLGIIGLLVFGLMLVVRSVVKIRARKSEVLETVFERYQHRQNEVNREFERAA